MRNRRHIPLMPAHASSSSSPCPIMSSSMQDAATIVGKKIAEIAKGHGIEKVAFDRGGFAYHGRVKVSHRCSYGQACGKPAGMPWPPHQ